MTYCALVCLSDRSHSRFFLHYDLAARDAGRLVPNRWSGTRARFSICFPDPRLRFVDVDEDGPVMPDYLSTTGVRDSAPVVRAGFPAALLLFLSFSLTVPPVDLSDPLPLPT